MNQRVLFVDDEEKILEVMVKLIRPTFLVATANSGREGLRVLDEIGEVAVVVSDYMMPEMNGVEFLKQVRQRFPNTVRIIFTGFADEQVAINAVNEGAVFRFLTKPIDRTSLLQAVSEAVQNYNLKATETDLLEKTLQASVEVLTELLGMADPVSFSRAGRMYRYVRDMTRVLDLEQRWSYEIAALLSQIGCISLPKDLVNQSVSGMSAMTLDEVKQFQSHASLGANLVENIPRLGLVADVIRRQFESRAFPVDDYKKGVVPPVEIGSQLLKIALRYDLERMHERTHEETIEEMRKHPSEFYIPFVEALYDAASHQEKMGPRRVNILDLLPGMVLAADVRTEKDVLVATHGQEITRTMISRIEAFHKSHGIRLPLMVHVPGDV